VATTLLVVSRLILTLWIPGQTVCIHQLVLKPRSKSDCNHHCCQFADNSILLIHICGKFKISLNRESYWYCSTFSLHYNNEQH